MYTSRTRILLPVLTAAVILLVCVGCSRMEAGGVYLYTGDPAAPIHNADGEYLRLAGGRAGGEMELLETVSQTADDCLVKVLGSDCFTFEGSGDKKVRYGVRTDLDPMTGREYTVTGTGVSTAAISPDGNILINGDRFTFEAFGTMRSGVLGSHGNILLSGMADRSAEIYFDEQNGAVFFDGVDPGLLMMTINGNVSAKSIVLPNLESGTIQLAGLANGAVTVVGASGDIQTIPVKTYVGPTDG